MNNLFKLFKFPLYSNKMTSSSISYLKLFVVTKNYALKFEQDSWKLSTEVFILLKLTIQHLPMKNIRMLEY